MRKEKWMKTSKVLALMLSAAMVITALPATVRARVENTIAATGTAPKSSVEQGGLNLTKTAKLENDGTYTLQLEAFATGTTVTSISTKPADIVLVLDVSGSMDENFTYVTDEKYNITDEEIQIADMRTENLYHLCPDGTYSTIHWTTEKIGPFGWGTRYRYICDHCLATRKHDNPLTQKIKADWGLYTYGAITATKQRMLALKEAANLFINGVEQKNALITDANMKHRVSVVKFASNSYGDDNMNTFDEYGYNHSQIVQALTSDMQANRDAIGALRPTGATASDYGMNRAERALANTPSDRDKIVILFTDGTPTYSNQYKDTVANGAIATAKKLKDAGATVYTVGIFDNANPADTTGNENKYMNYVSSNYPSAESLTTPGTGSNKGFYKVATDTKSLNNIFTEISSSVGTTTVELTAEAVMKDILGDGFVTTSDTEANAYTVKYTGRNRDGVRKFGTEKTLVSVTNDGTTFSVTGFNYKADCLIDGEKHDDNDFLPAKQGKKLVLEIKGVEATDAAIADTAVNTNGIDSGIYENAAAATPSARFPMPQTKINTQAYVLDYAKEVTLTDMGQVTHVDADGMNKFATSTTSLDLKYGDVKTISSYVPKTMNWDGYDTYYAFGKNTPAEGVTTGDNVWTKVSILPATSVYYEDDFVTSQDTGVVGIEYTGNWEVVGETSGNTEEANNSVQGWIDALADDTTYSDGSAHKGMVDVDGTLKAEATFTFTGTGVDIYSQTDATTGTVLATLSRAGEEKSFKALIIDNKANDGTYYQIPTLFFNELDYGTYTVTIRVTNAAKNDGGRVTYYLDGIRVYNPLNPDTVDSVVDDAYANQNASVSATFYSLRDFILDPENKGNVTGAYFIDEVNEGDLEGQKTSKLSKYEDLGPKNEVYLAPGQSVVFSAYADYIYVGLKAPKGETTVAFTAAESAETTSITGPADLYYKVVPDKVGNVTIKNTGSNILSITKYVPVMPLFGDSSSTFGLASMSAEDAVAYANAFAALPCSEYTANVITEEEVVDDVQDSEAVVPEEDQNTGDVEVDNGETEVDTPVLDWVKSIIEKLRGWFN